MTPHHPMTEQQLQKIEARVRAASPGPWEKDRACGGWPVVVNEDGKSFIASFKASYSNQDREDANAELTAHSRQDLPALLAEVRRLREALRGLPTGHNHWDSTRMYGAGCPLCIEQREYKQKALGAVSGRSE